MAYESNKREALRLLQEHAEKLQNGRLYKNGEFDKDRHNKISSRVAVLLQEMSSEVSKECHRVGAWGVIGSGSGGQIVMPGTSSPIKKDDLIGKKQSDHSLN